MSTSRYLQHADFFVNAGNIDRFEGSGVHTNHRVALSVAFNGHLNSWAYISGSLFGLAAEPLLRWMMILCDSTSLLKENYKLKGKIPKWLVQM